MFKRNMIKRLTAEEFVERAKKIHGEKYNYDKIDYLNNHTKVCIICPIHGEFWQTPNAHLNGQGCKKCGLVTQGRKRALSKETFVDRVKSIHGNKYDYSKVDYVNANTKVCIICPIHGEFWQTPSSHLSGHGCNKCGLEKTKDAKKFTNGQFIEKAIKIHGDKYDYSKVDYVNSQTPIKIICRKHGEFSMRPNDHLQGQGCPKCKLINLRKKFALTTEEFIEKAKKVHGNKYDYSKVKYVNNRTKVCIVCHKHGEFWQAPDKHLLGKNCPKCNSSKLEEKIRILLVNNNIKFIEQYHFSWFKKSHMKIDFYLPDYNIAIECQGIQHFKPVKRFGGINGFEECFKNDKIKYEECHKNNVRIIYYTELPEYFLFLNEKLIKNENVLLETIVNEIK